ncbi:MAG TPA: hypothetical protein VGJ33_10505 [Candidatus Angelobacter sp.]|jgi:hypothetical protein
MADNSQTLKTWQEAASATKDCLSLEVLERIADNTSTDANAARHLAGCAHCQTEISLLKSFQESTPSADEGAAVAWIAAQLQRNQAGPVAKPVVARVPFWRAMFRVPYMAGAAALAVALVLGISLHNSGDSGPVKIRPIGGPGVYRSGAVKLVSPMGEIAQPPAEFRWEAVKGASSYSVELKDVAEITLASAKATENSLTATPEMKANMARGKPLKWTVTALDASGKEIARSNAQSFKVLSLK